MKIEEAIKKAYLDGITEAHIMERMEMNFDEVAMADSYTIDLVKKLTIPVVINCLSCGKNHAEICGSCVSDIAQATGEQATQSR